MAKVTNKKVSYNKALLKTIEGIDTSNVKEVADFGHFTVVILKDGAIFHTHLGFELRCRAWAFDLNGKAIPTTLFQWLCNLVDMKKTLKGHESDIFPETDVTYQDVFDSMCIITEANICHPMTAFVDADDAAKFADERITYLTEKQKELAKAMESSVKEETEEDLKRNFEHGQMAVISEQIDTKGLIDGNDE